MDVGFKIRKIRELRNLTQQYVAEEIGVSQAYYNLIENNKTRLDIQRLQMISEILEFDLSSFWNFNPLKSLNDMNTKKLDSHSTVVGNRKFLEHVKLLEAELFNLKRMLRQEVS